MTDKVRRLLQQINELEDELRDTLHAQETRLNYRISGARIEFEQAVRQAHRELKIGVLHWFRTSRPQNVLSAPVIYAMVVPFLLLDVSLSVYQAICFRLYGIARVRRSDYVVMDRHHLSYLNVFEKINCLYCGYGNGVIAYSREIAARTEQYWCPIKHARKVLGSHERYEKCQAYGFAESYHENLQAYRDELANDTTRAEK